MESSKCSIWLVPYNARCIDPIAVDCMLNWALESALSVFLRQLTLRLVTTFVTDHEPSSFQLLYLKIIAILFPTSDFWHPVTTPAMVYMSQLLTKVRQQYFFVSHNFILPNFYAIT